MACSTILGKCLLVMLGAGGVLSGTFSVFNSSQSSQKVIQEIEGGRDGDELSNKSSRGDSDSKVKLEPATGTKTAPDSELKAMEREEHTLGDRSKENNVADAPSSAPVVNIPLVEKVQDLQNNWFWLDSQYLESLDQEELDPKECSNIENRGKVRIECPWILSTPQAKISFYFDLSLNPKLSGKKLDNLQELKVDPRSDELINLGMVFGDNISEEIEINLPYRKS